MSVEHSELSGERSAPKGAVFLSYASQDVEAAKRICDALRQAGVEVWFDQSELVGGDQWDGKIRGQIGSCALFVPIISANTQARLEGYFRLEWKLAAQRTHTMADEKSFLLPVVIDGTRDAEAKAPAEFKSVQWTKLPGGETPEKFSERVKRLLSGTVAGVADPGLPGSTSPATSRQTEAGQRSVLPSYRSAWLVPAVVAVVALAAAGSWYALRSSAPLPPASSLLTPPVVASPAAKLTPARQLAAKSAKLHDQMDNPSRSDLELAEQFCQQAVALDPNDGELWAEYSLVSGNYIAVSYDRSNERILAVRAQADRAVKLAPDSNEAQFALASSYRWRDVTRDEAIRRLRELVERMPGDRRVLRSLANALRTAGQSEEALVYYSRAAALPGGDPLALFQRAMALEALGRNAEAIASLDESLALHPGAAAYLLKVLNLVRTGEMEAAQAVLDKVPAPFLVESRGALAAAMVYARQRQWDRCLSALLAAPHDYFDDSYFHGPKGLWTGDARFHAGRKLAAELDWRAALKLVNQRLAGTQDTGLLHFRKAELHARLGEADEADRAWHTYQELRGRSSERGLIANTVNDVWLNRTEAALESLRKWKVTHDGLVSLRLDAHWDPLRADPRFQALLVEPVGLKTEDRSQKTEVSAPVDQKSVAVLAFANLSDDKANEYFSDGISEELLNVLAKVPGLKVSARTSAFYFKGKEVPVPEIAKQLGVAYVVEGSVRKAGDRVRITAQLIKAADGFHVWSDTFTRELKDIFAVQDEIAGLIAKNLQLKLGAGDSTRDKSTDVAAWQLYLDGRRAWNLRTLEGYREAETLFQRAIALDARFARAYAALADAWQLRAIDESSATFSPAWRTTPTAINARTLIDQALEIDPNCSEAFASLGMNLQLGWQEEAADRAYLRAIELNPNYASAHQWYGLGILGEGRIDAALAALKRAAELDPLSHRILSDYAFLLNVSGQPEQALAMSDRALSIQPGAVQAVLQQARALALLRRPQEAINLIAGLPARELSFRHGAEALAILAITGQAEAIRRFTEDAGAGSASMLKFFSLAAVGRTDEALANFSSRVVGNGFGLTEAAFGELFKPLREDPRFQKLIEASGRAEYFHRAQAWRAAHPPEKSEAKK